MYGERLVDLDELVLRCRNEQAKQYIAEAVACYRAGAFRACIVSTWVAVAFDFIYKLRELELAGDAKAQQVLKAFEGILNNSDIGQSLTFEKQVLDKALKDFELISPLEYNDLKRLFEDRNRCAHPSLNSPDETYQPTGELARYHIRNAVTYLLQYPPVQGKTAMERLKREINSEYFPTDLASAITYLKQGPLAKPRDSLVREFLRVMVKDFFFENLSELAEQQRLSAFMAVRQMHRQVTEKFLTEKLSGVMINLDDIKMSRAIRFLHAIPDCWNYLQGDTRIKLENLIINMPTEPPELFLHLCMALDIPEIRDKALQRIKNLPAQPLRLLIEHQPRIELVDPAITLYSQSKTDKETQSRGYYLLIPLSQFINPSHLDKILKAAANKPQIKDSFGFEPLLKKLRKANQISATQFDQMLNLYGFMQFSEIIPIENEPIVDSTALQNSKNEII